jgi:hypothetical protein
MGIGLTFGSVKKYFKLLCLSCNNPSPIVISWIRLIYYLRTDNLLFFHRPKFYSVWDLFAYYIIREFILMIFVKLVYTLSIFSGSDLCI